MKKSYYPTLIALSFFAGIFLVVFTTGDSETAATRFILYLVVSSVLAVTSSYWMPYVKSKVNTSPSKFDHVLQDAEVFSKEYGDVYVLADKLKQQKKLKKGKVGAHKPAL
ncbi:MAG: hypothetical protein ACO1OQ_08205 [Rufibacter sp.]